MEEFKSVIHELPVALFIVDECFKIKYFNHEFAEIFNADESMINQYLGSVIGCCKCGEIGNNDGECEKCELRRVISSSDSKIIFNRLIEKELQIRGKKSRYNIKLSVKKTNIEEWGAVYVCLINNILELSGDITLEQVNNKKLLHDMSHASNIQHDLLPAKGSIGFVDIDYIYEQSYPIGGDFFGVYRLNKNMVGVYIADVSGHGMSSGMLTVFLNQVYPYKISDPKQILLNLNNRYAACNFSGGEYITVMPLIFNKAERTITFSNAGHITPVLIIRDGKLIEYSISGTPISGWFTKYNYEEVIIEYNKGDKIVLFTDGAIDLKSSGNREFGIEKFKETLLSAANSDIHQLREKMQETLKEHSRDVKIKLDDIAVLFIQV